MSDINILAAVAETLIMAPKPKTPIPKALAGGSLITEIIINKYQSHLPYIDNLKS